jgi:hypothetical protein
LFSFKLPDVLILDSITFSVFEKGRHESTLEAAESNELYGFLFVRPLYDGPQPIYAFGKII